MMALARYFSETTRRKEDNLQSSTLFKQLEITRIIYIKVEVDGLIPRDLPTIGLEGLRTGKGGVIDPVFQETQD